MWQEASSYIVLFNPANILLFYRSLLYIDGYSKLFDVKVNYDSQVEVELDNISYQFLAEMTYVRHFFFSFTVVYI